MFVWIPAHLSDGPALKTINGPCKTNRIEGSVSSRICGGRVKRKVKKIRYLRSRRKSGLSSRLHHQLTSGLIAQRTPRSTGNVRVITTSSSGFEPGTYACRAVAVTNMQ